MDDIKYTVYAKTNENGIITAINSSAFISDATYWTEIDEGEGDKYHHAQNNYLSAGLMDENGIFNYKLTDGNPELRTAEEKAPELGCIATEQKIAELKQQLAELDLQAVRPLRAIAAGTATDEDKARLTEIELQVETLRAEIANLGKVVTE